MRTIHGLQEEMLYLVMLKIMGGHIRFRLWKDRIVSIKHERMVYARAASRWLRMHLSSSFQRWTQYIDEVKRSRADAARMHRVCQRITSRWLRGSMLRCFNTWSAYIWKMRREKKFLRTMLSRMSHRQIHAAFQSWCSFVHQHNTARQQAALEELQRQQRTSTTQRFVRRWTRRWLHGHTRFRPGDGS